MSSRVERAAIPGADAIPTPLEPEEFQRVAEAVQREVSSAIVGQEEAIQGVLITLIAGGHALLEGVPGLGKTSLVRAFARALDLRRPDRKSTRLNSSHRCISYAVFCLKKKKKKQVATCHVLSAII